MNLRSILRVFVISCCSLSLHAQSVWDRNHLTDVKQSVQDAYYAASLPVSCREEMLTTDGGGEEELSWWAAGVKADYHLIMGLRNEVAIAALALRRWDVYGFNNFQFSHLYKLLTKDSSLEDFYLQQRKARSSLNMGIVLLVLLVSLFALSAFSNTFVIIKQRKQKL